MNARIADLRHAMRVSDAGWSFPNKDGGYCLSVSGGRPPDYSAWGGAERVPGSTGPGVWPCLLV